MAAVVTFAQTRGPVGNLRQLMMDEETDRKLTELAESEINFAAQEMKS